MKLFPFRYLVSLYNLKNYIFLFLRYRVLSSVIRNIMAEYRLNRQSLFYACRKITNFSGPGKENTSALRIFVVFSSALRIFVGGQTRTKLKLESKKQNCNFLQNFRRLAIYYPMANTASVLFLLQFELCFYLSMQ